MSEELKSCPFCGGEAFVHMLGNEIAKGYYIACDECGAKTIVFGYETEAIEAWNRRIESERMKGNWIERKKGKWVYDGIRGRFPACKCSICGHYENADWALLQGANFCPNCGADMRDE